MVPSASAQATMTSFLGCALSGTNSAKATADAATPLANAGRVAIGDMYVALLQTRRGLGVDRRDARRTHGAGAAHEIAAGQAGLRDEREPEIGASQDDAVAVAVVAHLHRRVAP